MLSRGVGRQRGGLPVTGTFSLCTPRLCFAAAALWAAAPGLAQTTATEPQELDPSAPLDALPDVGVDWPDLDVDPVVEMSTQPEGADTPGTEPPVTTTDSAESALHYTVVVEGLERVADAEALLKRFEEQSALHQAKRDEGNPAQVDRRSRADAELLAELLRSHGYFDAMVEPSISAAGESLQVVLTADPGEQYLFQSVELPGLEAAGEAAKTLREAFAVSSGDPVVAEDVIAAGAALKIALGEEGFALAEVGEQDIEIDHDTRRARLVLPVKPGAVTRFGVIRVTGQPPFSARHVGLIARFEPGEPFRRSRVDDLRRALIATGLVANADVKVVPASTAGLVDLEVRLDPAPMRTIAGELGYGTGEGARVQASWQHRNMFNPEGALTVRGLAGTKEQLVGVDFRRNNFLRRDQVLNLRATVSNAEFDAYEARTILLGGNIERQSNIIWHKKWTWSYGAELLATDERGVFDSSLTKSTKAFFIAAAPVWLGYDGSDDLLNPTRGFRLTGRASPELSVHSGGRGYARLQLDASAYHPVSEGVVAAGRVRVGTIAGAGLTDIAPSRRFYSGGGGSVRGYGYQRLGPRDIDGDPIGGRGLAEFALEARVRLDLFGGNFGIVPFLDGGSLSGSIAPDFGEWQFGAGLGIRYYSNFGPIRVDVGTPLNPRSGDGRVAVVVSLGQAF